jgi:hypothetical protein
MPFVCLVGMQPMPLNQEDAVMPEDTIIDALKRNDANALRVCARAGPGTAAAIAGEIDQLEPDARFLAVDCLALMTTGEGGRALLEVTDSEDPMVAKEAADALSRHPGVNPGEILKAIPRRDDPFVRGRLYQVVGNSRDSALAWALGELVGAEDDEDAERSGRAALAKLGDKQERERLLRRLENADADEAIELTEDLVYVGDPRLALGLLPWLDRKDDVFRQGSDRQPERMIRMCDLAVWTAHSIGVSMSHPPAAIDIYDESTIADARYAIQRLR